MEKTFVTFVLDETGSMMSIKDDTIGGFNAYLKDLKDSGNEILFTLLKFDSNRRDIVYNSEPIASVAELTKDTYKPGAMTPLIDACYKAIKATEKKVAEDGGVQVAITIQTDGYENASTEFTNDDLCRLIKEKTAQGWLFTFLGAGIDAFAQARAFGIAEGHTLNYGRAHSSDAFAAVGQSTARYMSTGLTAAATFTAEERRKADPDQTSPTLPLPPTPQPTARKDSVVEDIDLGGS